MVTGRAYAGADRRFDGLGGDSAEDGCLRSAANRHADLLGASNREYQYSGGASVASIVLGAFAALAQTDFKRLVAYSSVNHMGYATLGIFVIAAQGGSFDDKCGALTGAMLQMFNPRHQFGSALLYGGCIYETHAHAQSG